MSIFGGLSGASQNNFVEGSTSANNAAKLQDDLNQFLTLLVTQLQNQDPLDPMDSNEFTQQLVQFAGVEQQIYQNSNLEQLLALETANQTAGMVEFIDRAIEAIGDNFPLENGEAAFAYAMPEDVKSGSIIIYNSVGTKVFETDAVADAGKHMFAWDGTDNEGNQLPDGQYSFKVTGVDQDDKIVNIATSVYGRVTGVGVQNGQTIMFMGDIQVPQSRILSVRETVPAAPDQPSEPDNPTEPDEPTEPSEPADSGA